MASRADAYFLPYQLDWIKDASRFKIVEKSRRVGMTYAQSYEDVVDAARAKGGMDVWFSSADETAAREYIRYCAQWAKLFDIAARDLGELVIDKKDDVKAFVIELASGKRINALSSNPKARRYKVIVNGDDDELFTARTREIRGSFADGECFYFTVNALSSGVRGRSDLLAQADWLDAYDDFLFGEHDRTRYQRAFVWDVTLSGLTQEQIDAQAKNFPPPAPNTVNVHNESVKWAAVSPDLKAGDTADAARLLRNHVLGGSTIPEHWFGGGGDVNRAVGAEMGEPTFKLFSMRQRDLRYILEEIGRYVLRQRALAASESGIDLDKPECAPQAVFPEMISRDITRYATALQQVVVGCALACEKRYLTRKTAVRIIATVAERLGLEIDAEQELADALAEGKAEDDDNAEDDLLPPDTAADTPAPAPEPAVA